MVDEMRGMRSEDLQQCHRKTSENVWKKKRKNNKQRIKKKKPTFFYVAYGNISFFSFFIVDEWAGLGTQLYMSQLQLSGGLFFFFLSCSVAVSSSSQKDVRSLQFFDKLKVGCGTALVSCSSEANGLDRRVSASLRGSAIL